MSFESFRVMGVSLEYQVSTHILPHIFQRRLAVIITDESKI